MKLLADNQLPLALARFLAGNGFECRHVLGIGSDSASDPVIWEYAKSEGLVIVTKDEDFAQLADRQNAIPPQVLWVRLGNCRKAALLEIFAGLLPQIREQLQEGHAIGALPVVDKDNKLVGILPAADILRVFSKIEKSREASEPNAPSVPTAPHGTKNTKSTKSASGKGA